MVDMAAEIGSVRREDAQEKLTRILKYLEAEARRCVAEGRWGKFGVTIRDGVPVTTNVDLSKNW
jgi:hypothetical protein